MKHTRRLILLWLSALSALLAGCGPSAREQANEQAIAELRTEVAAIKAEAEDARHKQQAAEDALRVERAKEKQRQQVANIQARRAIGHVLKSAHDALIASQVVRRVGENYRTNINERVLITRCNQIDTSQCPKDFKVAWFDYLTDCQDKDKHQGKGILDSVVGLVAMSNPATAIVGKELIKDAAKNEVEAAQEDPQLAYRRVLHCCLEVDLRQQDIQ